MPFELLFLLNLSREKKSIGTPVACTDIIVVIHINSKNFSFIAAF